MDSLAEVAARLAAINGDDLTRLRATIDGVPQTAPALLAWFEHAIDWERGRRRSGLDYPMRGPTDAIPHHEFANSIAALDLLAATFPNDSPSVAALFGVVGVILRAAVEGRRILQ